jgi:hypothetical protein
MTKESQSNKRPEYQLPNAIDLHSGMAPADKWVDRGLVSKD